MIPIKNINDIYHTVPRESSFMRYLKGYFKRMGEYIGYMLLIALIMFLYWYVLASTVIETQRIIKIGEPSPVQRRQVIDLQKRHRVKGLTWAIDIRIGDVDYYRKGKRVKL